MKLLKKINNNYVLAEDSQKNIVIVSGRGIGFQKMPCELNDLSKIEKTYYGVGNSRYLSLIPELPEDILELCSSFCDKAARTLQKTLNPGLTFTLADHIRFAAKRVRNGILFKYGMYYQVQYQYEKEMELAKSFVRTVNKKLSINLPDEESAVIAMHLVEAQEYHPIKENIEDEPEFIEHVVKIVEDKMGVTINRKNFAYFRFVTHLQHLIERLDNQIESDNSKIFEQIIKEYPRIYECACSINNYFLDHLNRYLNDEELLYLTLHINRVISAEDCNH